MCDLVLKNVNVGYKGNILVREINTVIGQGKLIALLGDNGSGKSTIMRTLLKINPVISGEITYLNKNIDKYNLKEWSNVWTAVFSRLEYIPHITALELMQIGAKESNLNDVWAVVDLLKLNDFYKDYVTTLSDGQLQKIMIARALMQDTPYIFFDEPTAHLDYKNKGKIFNLLKEIVENSGKTILIITHEIMHALNLVDEVWLINNGKLYIDDPQKIDEKFNLKKKYLNSF